ncbi:unnamed protein product [Notodromas monacha]|uniref:Pro-resilin n=1 Tax=Notodromas monacha TaxID=399045 RepID=A0A7R9GGH7_9CRUS|nr:unnamed protein product [Notodromas monacha]CAG0921857.1 unnamed protein product [Notodromas monacha]
MATSAVELLLVSRFWCVSLLVLATTSQASQEHQGYSNPHQHQLNHHHHHHHHKTTATASVHGASAVATTTYTIVPSGRYAAPDGLSFVIVPVASRGGGGIRGGYTTATDSSLRGRYVSGDVRRVKGVAQMSGAVGHRRRTLSSAGGVSLYGASGAVTGTTNRENYAKQHSKYSFQWDVDDTFSHREGRDGVNTEGEYRVMLPDGRLQIVSYDADENGYRAKVTYNSTGRHPTDCSSTATGRHPTDYSSTATGTRRNYGRQRIPNSFGVRGFYSKNPGDGMIFTRQTASEVVKHNPQVVSNYNEAIANTRKHIQQYRHSVTHEDQEEVKEQSSNKQHMIQTNQVTSNQESPNNVLDLGFAQVVVSTQASVHVDSDYQKKYGIESSPSYNVPTTTTEPSIGKHKPQVVSNYNEAIANTRKHIQQYRHSVTHEDQEEVKEQSSNKQHMIQTNQVTSNQESPNNVLDLGFAQVVVSTQASVHVDSEYQKKYGIESSPSYNVPTTTTEPSIGVWIAPKGQKSYSAPIQSFAQANVQQPAGQHFHQQQGYSRPSQQVVTIQDDSSSEEVGPAPEKPALTTSYRPVNVNSRFSSTLPEYSTVAKNPLLPIVQQSYPQANIPNSSRARGRPGNVYFSFHARKHADQVHNHHHQSSQHHKLHETSASTYFDEQQEAGPLYTSGNPLLVNSHNNKGDSNHYIKNSSEEQSQHQINFQTKYHADVPSASAPITYAPTRSQPLAVMSVPQMHKLSHHRASQFTQELSAKTHSSAEINQDLPVQTKATISRPPGFPNRSRFTKDIDLYSQPTYDIPYQQQHAPGSSARSLNTYARAPVRRPSWTSVNSGPHQNYGKTVQTLSHGNRYSSGYVQHGTSCPNCYQAPKRLPYHRPITKPVHTYNSGSFQRIVGGRPVIYYTREAHHHNRYAKVHNQYADAYDHRHTTLRIVGGRPVIYYTREAHHHNRYAKVHNQYADAYDHRQAVVGQHHAHRAHVSHRPSYQHVGHQYSPAFGAKAQASAHAGMSGAQASAVARAVGKANAQASATAHGWR